MLTLLNGQSRREVASRRMNYFLVGDPEIDGPALARTYASNGIGSHHAPY
jgi:hypothetical protein